MVYFLCYMSSCTQDDDKDRIIRIIRLCVDYKNPNYTKMTEFRHPGNLEAIVFLLIWGRLRGLAVACWTTGHYHPCSNLGADLFEDCFIFDSFHYLWRSLGPFSLPCAQKWP